MQNTKVVYSMRVYLQLQELGFQPISTTLNPHDNKLICWIYERTPEFLEALAHAIAEGGARNGK